MSQKKQKHRWDWLKKKISQWWYKGQRYLFSAIDRIFIIIGVIVGISIVIGMVVGGLFYFQYGWLPDKAYIDLARFGVSLVTLVMGFVALYFLIRRSFISEKQLKISQEGRDDDHFTRAIEQTANSNLAIRLAGLTALKTFSRKDQEKFQQTWDYLGEFLRHPPDYKGQEESPKLARARHPDISFIAHMLCDNDVKSLRAPNYRLPFSHTNLIGVDLRGAELSEADLSEANLSDADLSEADLSKANLRMANLGGVFLDEANLSGAYFIGADLRWADLGVAKLGGTDFSDSFSFGNTITEGAFLVGEYDLSMCRGLTKQHLEALYLEKNSPEPILPEELKDKVTWQRIGYLEWKEMREKNFIQRP